MTRLLDYDWDPEGEPFDPEEETPVDLDDPGFRQESATRVLSDLEELEARMRSRGELLPGQPSPFEGVKQVHRETLEGLAKKPRGPFPVAETRYGGLVPPDTEEECHAKRKA